MLRSQSTTKQQAETVVSLEPADVSSFPPRSTTQVNNRPDLTTERVAIPSDQPKQPQASCFTLGSTKEEVLAVQGTPESVIGNIWLYGFSSVEFSGDKVKGWSNISGNLKVKLSPSTASGEAPATYFTLGSTKDRVLQVQGTPDSIIGNTWRYGFSSVIFSDDKVIGWSNISGNLKVKLSPSTASGEAPATYFTLGSTKDRVLQVQGTPDSIIGNTWRYGFSSVIFSDDKVIGWSNISGNLKIEMKSR